MWRGGGEGGDLFSEVGSCDSSRRRNSEEGHRGDAVDLTTPKPDNTSGTMGEMESAPSASGEETQHGESSHR